MNNRLDVHEILVQILGTNHVYFQPPESVKLVYPCIVYNLNNMAERYANNELYFYQKSYSITIIDQDPDSEIPEKMLHLPYCSFDRFYTADNLNHWVFTLFN